MQKYLTLLLIFSVVLGTPIFAGLTQDIASKQNQVNQLQSQYNTLNNEAGTLQGQADTLKTTRDQAETAKNNAQGVLNQKQSAYDAALAAYAADQSQANKTARDNAKDARDDAQDDYNDAVSAFNQANNNYNNKQEDADAKKADAAAKKVDLDKAKGELAALQALLNSEPFKFLDKFEDFVDANPAFDEDVNQVRNSIEADANRYANFDASQQNVQATYSGNSTNYFNKADEKFDAMQGVFAANSNKAGIDNVKEDYEEQMGEFFKYYAKDMVDKPVDPATGQPKYSFDGYMQDFSDLNTSFEGDIANLGFDAGNEVNNDDRVIDPRNALDKTVEAMTAGAVKIDLGWVGVGNWASSNLGTNIYDVIKNIQQGKLYNDNTLKDNTKWFTDSWQSMENAQMDIPVQNTAAAYGGMGANTSYVVNAYGQLVTDSNELNQYKNDLGEENESLSTYYRNERFNNRSYGYAYQNGTANVAAVTVGKKKYVLQHTVFTSPIVLDMDGDGRLEASSGEWKPMPDRKIGTSRVVEFDLNGDGFLELVEWVGANDGLLVQYTEGEINGHNLFGEAGGWVTGYEKMMLFDANKDMVLSGAELSTLSVWQDKNGNAQVDQGEITTLKEAGIESLNITHNNLQSSFTQNGAQKTMWDWYPVTLQVKRSE